MAKPFALREPPQSRRRKLYDLRFTMSTGSLSVVRVSQGSSTSRMVAEDRLYGATALVAFGFPGGVASTYLPQEAAAAKGTAPADVLDRVRYLRKNEPAPDLATNCCLKQISTRFEGGRMDQWQGWVPEALCAKQSS